MENKNSYLTILLAGILISVITGCTHNRSMDGATYARWVEDPRNGLCLEKQVGIFDFQLQYRPLDYVLAYQYHNGGIEIKDIPKKRKEMEGLEYFTFRVKSDDNKEILQMNSTRANDYYEKLQYMMSDAQQDISLIADRDTLHCVLYHFERNYGLSPWNTLVLAFEKSALAPDGKEANRTFIYNDKILGTGKIAMTIKGKDISEVPTWNLN